jgi:hypothetical protein
MSHYGDHDGKSETSSAVDREHYPDGDSEQHFNGTNKGPSQSEIARLAYQLWEGRGCPDNNHEQDWFEAERRLTEESETPQDLQIMKEQQGSEKKPKAIASASTLHRSRD